MKKNSARTYHYCFQLIYFFSSLLLKKQYPLQCQAGKKERQGFLIDTMAFKNKENEPDLKVQRMVSMLTKCPALVAIL